MCKLLDKVSLVWFDLDDTLWDFTRNSEAALRSIYTDHALWRRFPSPEDWIECYEAINTPLWARYDRGEISKEYLQNERFYRTFVNAGFSSDELLQLQGINEEYLYKLSSERQVIDGSREVLEALRRMGIRTGVLSNGFSGTQQRKLMNARLNVDVIVLSDEINVNKPDRRLFDYALRKAGVSASASLMVGDNPMTDIAGAINAGWRAVLFSPRETTSTPFRINATDVPVINRLEKILE